MPNPVREALDRAVELDRRRQAQIAEQVNIINRLLDGVSYNEVVQETVRKLAQVKVERDDLKLKVDGLLKDIERIRSSSRLPPE